MSKKLLRRKLAGVLSNLKRKRKYYCEVEYLEGTGTQYIDTGLDYFADFEVGIQLRTSVSNKALGNGTNYCMQRISGSAPCWQFTNGSAASVYNTQTPITEHHVMKWKDNKVYADGIYLSDLEKSLNAPYRMCLFGVSSVNKYPNVIYSCKLWNPDNGELVRDFIPVLDWDMRPCMYDRVSGQLFYNQATTGNDFSYGREIHYVDYLEADGTQYIDTGLLSTASSTVDIAFSFTSMESGVANNVGVFGGRNATTTNTFTFFKIASATPQYFRFDYNGQATVATASEMTWNTASKYRLQYDGTNCIATNTTTGESVVTPRSPASTFTQYPIHLFAVNTAGAIGLYLSGRIYYYKYSDGTKSVDMVPAIDENGVGYMFDRLSHTIYDNAGTGEFKYPARETEYIEVTDVGTNNQNPCIDLGLKYKSSMSIEAKYTRTEMGVSGSVLPLSNTTTQPLIYMPALNASSKNDRFVWRRPGLPEASYYYDFADYPMTVEFKVDAVNDALTVNGNVVKTGMIAAMNGYTSPYESNSNLYMLSINGTYGGMGKVYYLKLYDETQVYRDLIPVWKDGVACVYDKQNNVYYSNTKTGTVTCGKIVEPEYE